MTGRMLRLPQTSLLTFIAGVCAALLLAGCVGSTSQDPQGALAHTKLRLRVDVDHFGAAYNYHEVLVDRDALPAMSACSGQRIGACCVVPATNPVSEPSQPAGPTTPSAGAISVTDRTTGRAIGTLTYDASQGYDYISNLDTLWKPGDRIALAAPGDELPGFSLVVATPAAIAGVSPALDFGDRTQLPVVPRDADFTVTWTPDSSARTMIVQLTPYFTVDTGNPQVVCEATDAAGQVTISHQLLAFPGYSSGAQGVDGRLELIRPLLAAGSAPGVSVVTSAQIAGEVLLK